MGTRLLAGRELTEADNGVDARPVVVVDEAMAAAAWPGESPVGKRVMIMRPSFSAGAGFERYWAEVVGLVEHVRYDDVRSDGQETIYMPHSEWGWGRPKLCRAGHCGSRRGGDRAGAGERGRPQRQRLNRARVKAGRAEDGTRSIMFHLRLVDGKLTC